MAEGEQRILLLVEITSYGERDKLMDEVRRRVARILGLSFRKVRVYSDVKVKIKELDGTNG